MDPPLINEASFSAANPSSYSLAEIWPFPIICTADTGALGLGLRMGLNSGTQDGSVEESTVTEQSGGGGATIKPTEFNSIDESSKLVSTTNTANDLNDETDKRMKLTIDQQQEQQQHQHQHGGSKPEEEQTSKTEPLKDYIHVRARRGQATDSHSLAERARREKISERMKILQDLVPGCNKVIGKALVLDEIINYIQSLQRQVEFLSMKLEAVNSRMSINPGMEGFLSKDLVPQPFDATGLMFGPREYAQGSQSEWLHMQVGGNFERAT